MCVRLSLNACALARSEAAEMKALEVLSFNRTVQVRLRKLQEVKR